MLNQKIREELKEAMKAKDQLRVDTLRGALAAFTNELVAKGRKPTEELTDNELYPYQATKAAITRALDEIRTQR